MTILRKLVAVGAGALVVFHTLVASAAIDAYLWVDSAKGAIEGHSQRDPKATTVLEFAHGPTKPGDLKTALASGRRIHEPVTVVVKVDHATSQIWKALTSHDKLQLRLAFYRPLAAAAVSTPAAMQVPYYTLKLGDALVEKVEIVSPDKVQDPGIKNDSEYLRVSFTFRTIEWTYSDSSKTNSDDWTQ